MPRLGYSRAYASRSGVPRADRHLTLTAKERRGLQAVYVKVTLGLPTTYEGPLPTYRPKALFLGESHFARTAQMPVSGHTLPLEP